MAHLGFVFVDGVGIGPACASNPIASGERSLFAFQEGTLRDGRLTGLPSGWSGAALDATLGVEGLPQSASGQTALLTGVNAAAHLGHHQSAIPGARLRALIEAGTIFSRLRARGRSVVFANAYGRAYFERVRSDGPPRRASATTVACWAAGMPLRGVPELLAGEAVYHDVTREMLASREPDVMPIPVEVAAAHFADLVAANHLSFFEHFLTDLVGHGRIDLPAVEVLDRLESFVRVVAGRLDPARHGLLVTSDHGNLEDLSVRTHTRYPVPLLLWGRAREIFDPPPEDLTGVAPRLVDALS